MRVRTAVPVAALATLAVASMAHAVPSSTAAWGHGVEIAPLVPPTSPSPMVVAPLDLVPLVPPRPTPYPGSDLEIAPLIPKAPPPMIEIIRWKKKKVKRPRTPNYSVRQQTFNAYIAGEQSALLRWTIDVEAEPGLCNRVGTSTVVYFSSTRPVLLSAARRSMPDIAMPVTITFASSISYNPDIGSCLNLAPSSDCRLDARSLPGTARLATRGNGTTVRSLYLADLTIDAARAGSTCTNGLFGFPEILGVDSGVENAPIPWGAVNSRSQQNVNIGRSYGTAGNQSSGGTTCASEATGWACAFSSVTKWNLRLVRAPQKRVAGLR